MFSKLHWAEGHRLLNRFLCKDGHDDQTMSIPKRVFATFPTNFPLTIIIQWTICTLTGWDGVCGLLIPVRPYDARCVPEERFRGCPSDPCKQPLALSFYNNNPRYDKQSHMLRSVLFLGALVWSLRKWRGGRRRDIFLCNADNNIIIFQSRVGWWPRPCVVVLVGTIWTKWYDKE